MEQQKQTYTNPIEKIRKIYQTLSPIQKKIADLVLEQAETICFMRLEDIGRSVGVTNVTVIRFAKKLGYESFGAFKKELQNYVQMMVIPTRVIKSEISNFREAPARDFVRRAIQNEFDLMRATYDAISPDLLIETAEIIKNARKIYIVGTGLNEPITEILLTRLRFLCINAQIVCNDNATLLPYYLLDAGPEDTFIIFSFPNYKSFAINIAKCAQELGCHTICITDKTTAPTAYYAEKLLLCQTSSLIYYNSMTTPASLVTILTGILAILIQKDSQTQERIKHISSFFTNEK